MIQEICKDEKFLAQKAEQATPDDIQTATDLLETLEAHKDRLRRHGGEYDRRAQAHHRVR